jgi:hypothetical protein
VVTDYPKLFPEATRGAPPQLRRRPLITPAEGGYLNREGQRADVAILERRQSVSASTSPPRSRAVSSRAQAAVHQPVDPRLRLFEALVSPKCGRTERIAAATNGLAALNG